MENSSNIYDMKLVYYTIGNSKLNPRAYAPGMYKTYFKKLKKLGKKFACRGTCYFSTKNLSFFYTAHKICQFLLKQLSEHVTC
jgi:hypothetical protein